MLFTCIQYVFGRFRWVKFTRAVGTIVVVFFTLTNRALYSVIYVAATPVQYMVLLDRTRSEEYLQSYNESMKTKQKTREH